MSKARPDIKELFYEADTRKHQQLVAERLILAAKRLLDRAVAHDASKFSDIEKAAYIEPVWELNTKEVPYGSDEYKRLTKQMGSGWNHHIFNNSHHPENAEVTMPEFSGQPFNGMDLFDILEMVCDWIGAADRRGNHPSLPIKRFQDEKGMSDQLAQIIRNTLGAMGHDKPFRTAD